MLVCVTVVKRQDGVELELDPCDVHLNYNTRLVWCGTLGAGEV